MLPTVIIHNLISVDGRIDFWEGDLGLYYQLANAFDAGAILSGSETILKALSMFEPPTDLKDSSDPLSDAVESPQRRMVIVDSRGRIDQVHLFKKTPYWSHCTILCSAATPLTHLDYLQQHNVDVIVTGEDHVDLAQALSILSEDYGIKTIRIDSGGVLNGALMRAGLVDKISLLVAPVIIGRNSPTSLMVGLDSEEIVDSTKLKLRHVESLPGDHVWLQYEVIK